MLRGGLLLRGRIDILSLLRHGPGGAHNEPVHEEDIDDPLHGPQADRQPRALLDPVCDLIDSTGLT